MDDERGADAAFESVALVQLEGRIADLRPPGAVARLALVAAHQVDVGDQLVDGLRFDINGAMHVQSAGRGSPGTGAVVGQHHHRGVFEAPCPLEKVDQALQLVVRVVQEARIGFLGSRAEAPLSVRNVVPGGNARVARRQLRVFRRNADRLLARESPRARRIPPGVVAAAMARHVFRRNMVGKVASAERQVQKERRIGGDDDVVPDEGDGLIDQVLRQVIAAALVRIDGVAVAKQLRVPMVRRRAEKAVPMIEAAPRRPLLEWTGGVPRRHGRQVPLADAIAAVSRRVQQFRQRFDIVAYPAAVAGMVAAPLGDIAHARGMGVHARQQACAGRRAQRGHMKVVVPQATGG